MITDKLASDGAAKRDVMPGAEHRQHKGLTTERRIRTSRGADESGKIKQFKSAGQAGGFFQRTTRSITCFTSAAITSCRRAQSFQNADIPGLGGNQQRYHSGIIISPRRLTMPISWTTASQVTMPSHLFDGHRFRQVARLIDVAAAFQGNVIGEQLQRDVEQDRIELWLGARYVEHCVGRCQHLAGVGHGEDRPPPGTDFLDRQEVLG